MPPLIGASRVIGQGPGQAHVPLLTAKVIAKIRFVLECSKRDTDWGKKTGLMCDCIPPPSQTLGIQRRKSPMSVIAL